MIYKSRLPTSQNWNFWQLFEFWWNHVYTKHQRQAHQQTHTPTLLCTCSPNKIQSDTIKELPANKCDIHHQNEEMQGGFDGIQQLPDLKYLPHYIFIMYSLASQRKLWWVTKSKFTKAFAYLKLPLLGTSCYRMIHEEMTWRCITFDIHQRQFSCSDVTSL